MARPAHVPAHLVVDYDAFAVREIDEVLSDIERWRDLGPIVWTDKNNGHWIVTAMQPTRDILSDTESFTSAKPRQGITLLEVDRELHVPIEMDGVDHRQYRRILIPLFSPGRVNALGEEVREIARSLISEFADAGSCDVVADYARPLSGAMFMRLMDWPLQDRGQLEDWAALELNGPPGATPEERVAAKAEAHALIAEYVQARIDERSGAEGRAADMTTVIIKSRLEDGSPIPKDRLVPVLRLLMIAGLDTTQSVLSQALAYLAQHPETQEYVRTHRNDIPKMVEEFLRMGAPAMPSRSSLRDYAVGDVTIAAGDTVHLLLAGANRDETEFEDPLVINFARGVNRHLAFSVGPHKCIGAALARVVLAAAIDEFHQAIERFEPMNLKSHVGAVWGMNEVRLSLTRANAVV
jgi:cytochrome P450